MSLSFLDWTVYFLLLYLYIRLTLWVIANDGHPSPPSKKIQIFLDRVNGPLPYVGQWNIQGKDVPLFASLFFGVLSLID